LNDNIGFKKYESVAAYNAEDSSLFPENLHIFKYRAKSRPNIYADQNRAGLRISFILDRYERDNGQVSRGDQGVVINRKGMQFFNGECPI
jgi:hypothetical protein